MTFSLVFLSQFFNSWVDYRYQLLYYVSNLHECHYLHPTDSFVYFYTSKTENPCWHRNLYIIENTKKMQSYFSELLNIWHCNFAPKPLDVHSRFIVNHIIDIILHLDNFLKSIRRFFNFRKEQVSNNIYFFPYREATIQFSFSFPSDSYCLLEFSSWSSSMSVFSVWNAE